MLDQISGAQAVLEAQIDTLHHAASRGGDASALLLAEGQLPRLAGLGRRIEHAQGGGLVNLRAEVAAYVAAAQLVAGQTGVASASGYAAKTALHAAQAEARRVTGDFVHDFYERKIFDEYLRFDSPEEERAYREREEERRKAIEEARALGTPEGDRRALLLMREQLEDAGRHGADRSPEYAPAIDTLRGVERNLDRAIGAREDEKNAAQRAEEREALSVETTSMVSADIVASLKNAGVVIPASNPTLAVVAGVRPTENGHLLS